MVKKNPSQKNVTWRCLIQANNPAVI